MAGIMVVAAFAVALALLVGGYIHSRFSRGSMFLEGLGEFMFAEAPGAAGLVLAVVALTVWWLAPAWAWLPAALSVCASVSMLAVFAFSKAVDCLSNCWKSRRR